MKEFDFLPNLPKPNLDDRKFKDLVDECILRIPRYCPEWTNHNPSDPGITLIELFAWLTEQMLTRFNQVPLRNYITFLELLGIRLQPPVPARTELSFYLTKVLDHPVTIPNKTEVATVRTEGKEPIVFTTDQELKISNPVIKHFLNAQTDTTVKREILHDYTPQSQIPNAHIAGEEWWRFGESEDIRLFEESRPGNCFYLVVENEDRERDLAGHIIVVTFRGEPGFSTGIDPDNPPLRWEAWNGEAWDSTILRQKEDDRTGGFSFNDPEESNSNPWRDGAEILLHLPLKLPSTSFGTNYRGHWIRCVYDVGEELLPGYSNSPCIIGLSVQAIGITAEATQCVRIEEELLGISNGKSGQSFQLQELPVLARERESEYIEVRLPGKSPEIWQEVANFADSTPEDPHYTIDSLTGIVQFGPLVRDSASLKAITQERLELQSFSKTAQWGYGSSRDRYLPTTLSNEGKNTALERQYGKVLPSGAEIYMVAYRTGGGARGNVKENTLTVIKTSIPYVKSVTNYKPANGGIDAESLNDAVLRVPQILRTRECAVTSADFENAVKQATRQVAHAHCWNDGDTATPGIVRILVVPQVERNNVDNLVNGMNPDTCFRLQETLKQDIQNYISDRKPLGVQIRLEEPDYIGVKVELEAILEPEMNNNRDRFKIHSQILITLYRFINPLTGGIDGTGWSLGRPLYASDIVSVCRTIPGIRNLGEVKLFAIERDGMDWECSPIPKTAIDPGTRGFVCSWDDNTFLASGHVIEFVD